MIFGLGALLFEFVLKHLFFDACDLAAFEQGRQIGSGLLNFRINFPLDLQHFLLVLQLEGFLLLRLSLFKQSVLGTLLVLEIFRKNRITRYYLYLLTHLNITKTIYSHNQYRFRALTSQSAGGVNF